MRRLITITLCAVSFLPLAPCSFAADVIDGVVASVDRKPVLRSEWDEAVRFEAFMHQERLADVSESEKVAALQRLIDRELLDQQMANGTALRPTDEEVNEDLAKLRAQIPAAKDDAAWQALIRSYGLTEATIETHLRAEVRVMNFIDVQLRPNIRIQDGEVQAYYQTRLLPDLRQSGARTVPLNEIAPKIRELLVQEHMDQMLDAWLHNLRQQSHVETLVPLPAVNASSTSTNAEGGN